MPIDPETDALLVDIEQRISALRSHLTSPPEIEVVNVAPNANLQRTLSEIPEGVIADLGGAVFNTNLVISRPVTLRNGLIVAPLPGINDLVDIRSERVKLHDLIIRGEGSTKRGITDGGVGTELERVQVQNIRRLGQESQALAIWNGTGLTARHCSFEGGSISFLSGGTGTSVPNHTPSQLLFEDCIFTSDLAWRGQGYGRKTGFELKNARGVVLRRCTIENVYEEGQSAYTLTFTPSDPVGNSPDTTVEDVLVEDCIIRNTGSGANILGFTQHPSRPTQRGRNIRFFRNQFRLNKAQFGGHGTLMMLGRGPADIVWEDNVVITDGDAFIRTSDNTPITGFRFQRNIVQNAGTYGMFMPVGSRGAGFAAVFPEGVLRENTLHGAHPMFRASFVANTYLAAVV